MLLGPPDERRQLQDSSVLPDVWIAFAREPDRRLDLLITPYRVSVASQVATTLGSRLSTSRDDPNIAFLTGIVAATLSFEQLLRIVVPMTEWWLSPRVQNELRLYLDEEQGPEKLNRTINAILTMARSWGDKTEPPRDRERFSALDRYVALAGLMLWARSAHPGRRTKSEAASATDLFKKAVAAVRALRKRR